MILKGNKAVWKKRHKAGRKMLLAFWDSMPVGSRWEIVEETDIIQSTSGYRVLSDPGPKTITIREL